MNKKFTKSKKILSNLRKSFRSPLFAKSFLLLSGVLGLFIILCLIGFHLMNRHFTYKAETEKYSRVNERVASQCEQLFAEMSRISVYVATTPRILPNMNLEKPLLNQDSFYRSLMLFSVPNGLSRQRISVFNEEGLFYSVGQPVTQIDVPSFYRAPEFLSAKEDLQSRNTFFLMPHRDFWGHDSDYYPFSCIRALESGKVFHKAGIVQVDLPSDLLLRTLNPTDLEESYLLDKNGMSCPLHESDPVLDFRDLIPATQQSPANSETRIFEHVDQGKQYLCILRQLPSANAYLLSRIAFRDLFSRSAESFALVAGTLFAAYLVLMIVSFFFMRYFSRPLFLLREQIEKVNSDHLEIGLSSPLPSDETKLLNEALLSMVNRLHQSEKEKAALHSSELRAGFIALQAQINPHFLYNTLSAMSALTLSEDPRDSLILRESLGALSQMLRYITLPFDKTVSLQEELAHVNNHLNLMQLRYGDQLHVHMEIDNSKRLDLVKVPRVSLQPIVENAFSHGFSQILPPWELLLRISAREDSWSIELRNNGNGLNASERSALDQKLQALLKDPAKTAATSKPGGMGLINSLARFRYLYGEHFQYTIEGGEAEPEGASFFTIRLEGAYHCEDPDR